ncbi:MAG: type IV pilus modification PilV family protein [Rhodospirillaceae bacterium]
MHVHSKGFTLLEAIVAMAVMSLALIPLVSFVTQSANELQRAGESNTRSFVMQSALALMEPINPMVEGTGNIPLDHDLTLIWDTQTIVEPNPGIQVGSGLAAYRLGFYKVHVVVNRGQTAWFDFDMRKVGYEKTSQAMPGLDGTK